MRQVIRRFLKHLEAEKNASPSTIDSYQYDLNKFEDYVAHRPGNRFLPGDISHDHIRDYLILLSAVGHQKPNGSAKVEIKTYLKQRRRRNRTRALFISCRNRRISPWDCLVSSEEIFEEIPNQDARHGTTCFTPYFRDTPSKSGRELRLIQTLMNHQSLATTARYLHSRSQELVKAVNGLKLLGG